MSVQELDRDTVLMLDSVYTRRYHLSASCPHLQGADKPIVSKSVSDRSVERALLCSHCRAHQLG